MKKTIHLDTYQVIADAAKLDSLQVKDGEVDFTSEISGVDADLIERVKYKASAAGTNERLDVTVGSSTAGAEYKATLVIKRALGVELERVSASIIASSATATTTATELAAAINKLSGVSAVANSADVRITLETATGEVAGEGDILEVKVAKDGADSGFAQAAGAARVVPFGQYTQVQRLDDAKGVDFKGTAESGAEYDEVTFYLKGEGSDRKQITFWIKSGITHAAFTAQKLRSVGVSVGAAGDIFRLALTSEATGASARTGNIYVGGKVFYVDTAAAADNFVKLPEEFPHGSEVAIFNNSGSNVLKIKASGSENINNAATLDVPVDSMAILKKIADDEWGAVIS
jgi:hypothetical protein